MKTPPKPILRKQQSGAVLLEGLISILIFSLGILALVGMQAAAMKYTAEAKYRADASFMVSNLLAQMWADDPKTIAANYSQAGPKFVAWKTQLQAALVGLPNANATIAIAPTVAPAPTGSQVTVTLEWRHPQDPAGELRKHIAVAQIPVN